MDGSDLQQARCPGCNTPLDGLPTHSSECDWYYRRLRHQQNASNLYGDGGNVGVSAQGIQTQEMWNVLLDSMMLPIKPEPLPPRKVSWSDLLAEGLEADFRNFQKWLRSWKKPR